MFTGSFISGIAPFLPYFAVGLALAILVFVLALAAIVLQRVVRMRRHVSLLPAPVLLGCAVMLVMPSLFVHHFIGLHGIVPDPAELAKACALVLLGVLAPVLYYDSRLIGEQLAVPALLLHLVSLLLALTLGLAALLPDYAGYFPSLGAVGNSNYCDGCEAIAIEPD